MIDPHQPERPRDYEIPCVLHEPMDFDLAADQDLSGVPVRKDYSLCTILHAPMEFDAAEAEWIAIAFQFGADTSAANPAQDIANVVLALDQYDRSLGGHGFAVDPTRSAESIGQLCLVLRPVVAHGAAERLRKMAATLGCPVENDQLQLSKSSADTRLQETIGQLILHPAEPAPSLDAALAQLVRPDVGIRFGLRAA